jgi:cytochrome P450
MDEVKESPFAAKDRFLGIGLGLDPHRHLRELREGSVHAGSVSGQFGVVGPDNYLVPDERQVSVYRFDLVEKVFRDPQLFSSSYNKAPLREVIGRTILEMDPPDHQHYRMLLQGAFTKREMERWERDFVRDIVATALDRIVPLGKGDLARDFAFHYPITVTAVAAGLPVEDVPAFYEQAVLLTNVAAPHDERLRASAELGAIVQRLIVQRRREPRNDLISILAHAELPGIHGGVPERLSDDEIVAFLRLLVPAGAQTTYRMLTNLLYGLLTHPDQLDALRRDHSLVPKAIEEGLRWEPPLIFVGRTATADGQIAGCPVAAGTAVNLCLSAANRTPDRWPEPDEFNIFRPTLAHMSFGQGNHICLGIHFARMELRVALELILEKLPGLRLDPEHADDVRIDGLIARTAVSLPCLWDVGRSAVESGASLGTSDADR